MQREVLNRSVCCDGHEFPVGTPIELIPADNRESCQRSGWTHVVNVVEPGDGDEEQGPGQSNQTELKDPEPEPEPMPVKVPVAMPAVQADVDANAADEPLAETDLEIRVIDLLANAVPPITTKAHAREFLAANKTFRIIEGIGKASDAAIRSVIGAAVSE